MQSSGDLSNAPAGHSACGLGDADSPRSNASTCLSSPKGGEAARLSMDSAEGMYASPEQSINVTAIMTACEWTAKNRSHPKEHPERERTLSPVRVAHSAPRPSSCSAPLSNRSCKNGLNSTDSTMSNWRRQSKTAYEPELTSPGPASYRPDDRVHAHHRRFPNATFGHAPGHDLHCRLSLSPGPADFHGDDRLSARHRRSTSVPMGRGPGHESVIEGPPKSPSPTAYNADDRLLAGHRKFPSCTFGRSAGHTSFVVRDSSPAPGSYDTAKSAFDNGRAARKGVSLHRSRHESASAEERLSFRRADQDSNGTLDFNEVRSLLQARFPELQVSEVVSIFRDVDTNNDGKIEFSELLRFTRSTDPSKGRLRDILLMALAAPRCSSSFREGRERELFRKADLNMDGYLDMTEVESLMRSCFHDIKKRDVHDLFQGMDKNHNGKLDFHEVLQYTTSKDPSTRRLREKLQTALSAPFLQASSDCGGSSKPVSRRRTSMHRSGSATTVGSLIASS